MPIPPQAPLTYGAAATPSLTKLAPLPQPATPQAAGLMGAASRSAAQMPHVGVARPVAPVNPQLAGAAPAQLPAMRLPKM